MTPKGAQPLGTPDWGGGGPVPGRRAGLVSRMILRLDASLRRERGVIEFAGGSGILRVALIASDVEARLPSGLVIHKGDPIIELHFANERLPQAGDGAGIGWGAKFGRKLTSAFREPAVGVQIDPRLKDAKAVLGRLAFAGERNRGDTVRFGHRFGFECCEIPAKTPLARQFHDFGEDIWLVGLTWVFNRGSLKGRSVLRLREDLWMSPERLIEFYKPPEPKKPRGSG